MTDALHPCSVVFPGTQAIDGCSVSLPDLSTMRIALPPGVVPAILEGIKRLPRATDKAFQVQIHHRGRSAAHGGLWVLDDYSERDVQEDLQMFFGEAVIQPIVSLLRVQPASS